MPYFPPEAEVAPYYCPNCKAWWRPGTTSCCVLHPPGSCCHAYESRAEPPPPNPAYETRVGRVQQYAKVHGL